MRRELASAALVLAALAGAAPAAAVDYAPADRRGPPLTVSEAELRSSMTCAGEPSKGPDPVLMVPGTGADADSFRWNYDRAFDRQGRAHCTVTLDDNGFGDLQRASEKVVFALRELHARAGRPIDVVGYSVGGAPPRWALRFWPDTRALIDDYVGISPNSRGSDLIKPVCDVTCPAGYHQQTASSQFMHALNSRAEVFEGIDYTVVHSLIEEGATNPKDSRLRPAGPHVVGLAVQDICPGHIAEHFTIGLIDPVAYAVVLDALDHEGPVSPERVDRRVCQQLLMPSVDPLTLAVDLAGTVARLPVALARSPLLADEPPLRCYVTAACATAVPNVALRRRCVRGRAVAQLAGETNFVRAVAFKHGRRTLGRSTTSPRFRATLRRGRTAARRLRAVVELRYSGEPSRLVLTRSLPRC